MTTGEIIKAERKKAGLTQAKLGEKIGVSGSMIGQWENNLRNPKNESILKLGSVLGDSFIRALEAESIENLPWQFSIKLKGYSDEFINDMANTIKDLEIQNREYEKRLEKNIKVFINSENGRDLIENYFALNDRGQNEAVSRIYELTFLPHFTNQEYSDLLYKVEEYERDKAFKKKYNISDESE